MSVRAAVLTLASTSVLLLWAPGSAGAVGPESQATGEFPVATEVRLAGDEAAYYAGPIARAEATCLVALGRLADAKARIDIALKVARLILYLNM